MEALGTPKTAKETKGILGSRGLGGLGGGRASRELRIFCVLGHPLCLFIKYALAYRGSHIHMAENRFQTSGVPPGSAAPPDHVYAEMRLSGSPLCGRLATFSPGLRIRMV